MLPDLPDLPDLPAVEPPPTLPFAAEAVNAVALSGTVLTDPQIYCLPANQYAAHVRLGLSPRASRADLPQPAPGAVTVDAWGVLALQLVQHVHKGSRIYVRGALKEDSWADKATGERRWLVKVRRRLAHLRRARLPSWARHGSCAPIHPPVPPYLQVVAEELAMLAPPKATARNEEAGVPVQAATAQAATAQTAPPLPPQAAPQATPQQAPPAAQPRQQPQQQRSIQASAETSQRMYEDEGQDLFAIAAARRLKPTTVASHLLEAVAAGVFGSYPRLGADLQLGPPGGPWLSPSEVAEAVADVEAGMPGLEFSRLPLKAIRERLEARPDSAPKAAALLEACAGDPGLLYSAIKLVVLALECGVPFSAIAGAPPAGAKR